MNNNKNNNRNRNFNPRHSQKNRTLFTPIGELIRDAAFRLPANGPVNQPTMQLIAEAGRSKGSRRRN